MKKQIHHFTDAGLCSQSYGFSSSHVWMWELDHKEGWVPKNWCFWIVVLEKTFESPLDCKEINSVSLKGNQAWHWKDGSDAEAPILWPPDVKSWLIWKDPDPGKDWRQEEKGATEDEMVGWCHWLNGHKFEQTLGESEGQRSLACCSPWGCKQSDTTLATEQQRLSHCYKAPHQILPGWDTCLSRAGALCGPLCLAKQWIYSFYFTQNSVSEFQFGTRAQRPSFWHQE